MELIKDSIIAVNAWLAGVLRIAFGVLLFLVFAMAYTMPISVTMHFKSWWCLLFSFYYYVLIVLTRLIAKIIDIKFQSKEEEAAEKNEDVQEDG